MTQGEALQTGIRGTAETVVEANLSAESMGSGEIEVYATPAMIALMEAAAVNCVKEHLEEGTTSVGIRLDVAHAAATPLGMKVRAEAVLERIDGRRLFFQVTAYDEKEKIGEGVHERVVVARDRFMSKVSGKRDA